MLISRFWSLLGVHHIQNMTCYNLKFNTKPDMGSTSHPFSIYYLIFSSSQPIWFSDQGLFTIWTAFCSYQVKKKQNKTTKQKKQTNKQKRRKCPEMAFRPSQWDCSIGPSEVNNRFNFVLEIVQQYSLHLRQTNIKCTVLCKSNATEMREFCFLFKWTFVEIPCESSSDNLRLFEQKFRWTKSAVSLNVCFETKVQRNFVIKSVSLLLG